MGGKKSLLKNYAVAAGIGSGGGIQVSRPFV